MQGRPILYNGKPINKDHFRVYIYQAGGIKKLVNSYAEYESYISTGVWWNSEVEIPQLKEKVRAARKTGRSNPDIEETEAELTNDALQKAAINDKKDAI